MTEKNNIYIEDVVDVKELQTLQDNWAKATDLAFVTVDCNGTPITKQSNFTPFCKRLRELDAFREKCYYCDACGGRKARRIGKAYVYICHAGLIDFAIPIMIKGQYVGAFLAGQVTSTDFADLKKITTQSEDWKDNQELVELYNQVKEVSVEKIQAVAQIICDSYNYSVEREYANKVDAELREKDYKLMKEEKLRIEMEKSLRDIELKALHYQINPHFLFNTLDSINWRAIENDEEEISDMLATLGSLLRYSVSNIESMVCLEAEISWLKKYVFLQRDRFQNSFDCVYDVTEDAMWFPVYKMLLQPIIENTILHAFENVKEGGMINIEACVRKDGKLEIHIRDNGCGMDTLTLERIRKEIGENGALNSESIGISNVIHRLRIYYQEEADIMVKSKLGSGTEFILVIPRKDPGIIVV